MTKQKAYEESPMHDRIIIITSHTPNTYLGGGGATAAAHGNAALTHAIAAVMTTIQCLIFAPA